MKIWRYFFSQSYAESVSQTLPVSDSLRGSQHDRSFCFEALAYYAQEDHHFKVFVASSRYACSPVMRYRRADKAIWSLGPSQSQRSARSVKHEESITHVLVTVFLP